ncbi:M4 family metallopeptidase [Dyadobacter sp. BHUBP1]|uniref:M4 family metallopeptidase n=1 Tax=Dyadobacter sp. BHUBP1 TaxID=3424178 RepID=UPI003D3586A6
MKHFLSTLMQLLLCAHMALAQTSTQTAIEAFVAATGAKATVDSATRSLAFLRFPYPNALQVTGADAREKSLNFVSQYQALFGLRPGTDELQFREQKSDLFFLDHVTLQQTYKGVLVWDGVMRFHYDVNKRLSAVNGNYIADINVNPVPTLTQQDAEVKALALVTAQNLVKTNAPLKVNGSALYIFQKGLAQGVNGAKVLAYEVEIRNDADVREFLYIDAHTGQLAEQFTGIHGIDRRIYNGTISPENLKWSDAGGATGPYEGGYESRKAEIDVSGHVYNMMKSGFGWVSFDNRDSPMITVFNTPNFECPQSSWNGVSANFCADYSTDDIVGHEWAHAYIEHTAGLVTKGQAGAIDEALADVWGEIVDWKNSGYMDSFEEYPRTSYCSGSLWKIGEYRGEIRDMYKPDCMGNPGKLSDPEYVCANGGDAHQNSTVLSHAFALLGNGGVYNGQTFKAMFIHKLAHIAWRAQWGYMTKTTDFAAMADILEAAASDLIAFNLPELDYQPNRPPVYLEAITAEEVAELSKAIAAVELRGVSSCTVLPVTLASFEGRNTSEGNILEWVTSSESNNAYFAIERSTNARHFTEVGRVQGAGNVSTTNHYNFTDTYFDKGIIYYRLKQVDTDSSFAYSRIVAIDAPVGRNIRFYPNPIQSSLHIELFEWKNAEVTVKVTNTSGQTVMVLKNARIQNGKLDIQFGKQPPGIYQVLIGNRKASYQFSVLKL